MGGANVSVKAGKALDFGGTTGVTTGTFGTTAGTTGGTPGGTTGLPVVPGSTGGSDPTTTGGSVPEPETLPPLAENAAASQPLGGGLSPWLGGFALLGGVLMAFGFKRLPDKVLEAAPSACPLQES
jgi:hypothetical protein